MISKNVTLKLQNLETIMFFQNKTRKNFSKTLNVIIEQWDEYSIMVQKVQEQRELDKEVKNLKNAEVIKQ